MATKKTTKNGLLSGRDDDFGVFLSRRIEEQERSKKGGATKAVKRTTNTKKK